MSPSSEPPYAKPQKRTPSQGSAPSTPAAAPQREELESMLGNLHEDMKSQGVTTKTKGVCGACNQPVIGQVRYNPPPSAHTHTHTFKRVQWDDATYMYMYMLAIEEFRCSNSLNAMFLGDEPDKQLIFHRTNEKYFWGV